MDDRISVTLTREGDNIIARWFIEDAPQIFAINQDVKFGGPSFEVDETVWEITLRPLYKRGPVVLRPCPPSSSKRLACFLRRQDGNNTHRLYFAIDIRILINCKTWSRLEGPCYISNSQYLRLPLQKLSDLTDGKKFSPRSEMTIQITLQKFEFNFLRNRVKSPPKPSLARTDLVFSDESVALKSRSYDSCLMNSELEKSKISTHEITEQKCNQNVKGTSNVKDGSGGTRRDTDENKEKHNEGERNVGEESDGSGGNPEEGEKNDRLERNAEDRESARIKETDCLEGGIETKEGVGYIKRDQFKKEETDSTCNEMQGTANTKSEKMKEEEINCYKRDDNQGQVKVKVENHSQKEEGTDTCAIDAKEEPSIKIKDFRKTFHPLEYFYDWCLQKFSPLEQTAEEKTDYDEKPTTTSLEVNDQKNYNSKSDEAECGVEVTKSANEEKKATDCFEYENEVEEKARYEKKDNEEDKTDSKSDEVECGEEVTKIGNEEKKATDSLEYENEMEEIVSYEKKDNKEAGETDFFPLSNENQKTENVKREEWEEEETDNCKRHDEQGQRNENLRKDIEKEEAIDKSASDAKEDQNNRIIASKGAEEAEWRIREELENYNLENEYEVITSADIAECCDEKDKANGTVGCNVM